MARMRKQALLGWKQPRHKCAQSYHHKKERKERLGNNRKITHAGQELTEHENEKQVTEIALTALKNGKTSQNQQNANTSCEPAQHYQHSVKSRKTDVT